MGRYECVSVCVCVSVGITGHMTWCVGEVAAYVSDRLEFHPPWLWDGGSGISNIRTQTKSSWKDGKLQEKCQDLELGRQIGLEEESNSCEDTGGGRELVQMWEYVNKDTEFDFLLTITLDY